MPRKNLTLGLLVVVNLVLLSVLLGHAVRGQPAFAQPVNISSDYLAVAAEVQSGLDAVYLIDVADRRLYMLVPSKGGKPMQLEGVATRDLNDDFRVRVAP